jgi:hypothetical protein
LKETRLEGLYEGSLLTLSSVNVDFGSSGTSQHIKWALTPICKQGACNVVLRSKSGDYQVHLSHVGNRYAGQYTFPPFPPEGDCGGDRWTAVYRLTPTKAALVTGDWVVTEFKALLVESAPEGTCGYSSMRELATMKRHFD